MSFLTKDMYRIRSVDDSPSGVPGWQVAGVRAGMQLSPMRHTTLVLCSGIVLGVIIAPALSAQATGGRTAEQIRASYDAHHADFDYLLGDWEFTAVNRQYGTSRGFWSAVRLDDGQDVDHELPDVRGPPHRTGAHLGAAGASKAMKAPRALLTPPVGPRDHVLGPADARVTLVEYGDFECPFCGAAYPELKGVLRELGPKVRFVFRHFPLGEAHPTPPTPRRSRRRPPRRA